MFRHCRLIGRFTLGYWQVQAQYRLGATLWILNGLIAPLILMLVWRVVGSVQTLALSPAQVTAYFLLSPIIYRLTQTWLAEDLTDSIKEGRFSQYLVKPLFFIDDHLGKDQALRCLRLVTLIPLVILAVGYCLHYDLLAITPLRAGLFCLSLILGYGLNIIISVLIGLTAFWLEQAYGSFLLLMLVTDLFAGLTIPLLLMPPWLQTLTLLLPFYSLVGLPLDLILGTIPIALALRYLAIAFMWLAGLTILTRWLYHRALRLYTAVGL